MSRPASRGRARGRGRGRSRPPRAAPANPIAAPVMGVPLVMGGTTTNIENQTVINMHGAPNNLIDRGSFLIQRRGTCCNATWDPTYSFLLEGVVTPEEFAGIIYVLNAPNRNPCIRYGWVLTLVLGLVMLGAFFGLRHLIRLSFMMIIIVWPVFIILFVLQTCFVGMYQRKKLLAAVDYLNQAYYPRGIAFFVENVMVTNGRGRQQKAIGGIRIDWSARESAGFRGRRGSATSNASKEGEWTEDEEGEDEGDWDDTANDTE